MFSPSLHLKHVLSTTAILLLLTIFLLPVPALAQVPQAADDFHRVLLGEDTKTVTFAELLANDAHVDGATVTVVRHALREQSSVESNAIVFTPDNDFWSVGSDLVVYRVDTAAGSSFGTLYFATERNAFLQPAVFDFEDPNQPLPMGVGLVHDLGAPLIGTGSIRVQPASTDDDAYLAIPIDGEGESNVGSGETDGCAGGLAEIPSDGSDDINAAGYLLLLGDENADVTTAQARVGVTRGQGDLFIEVRVSDANGPGDFSRSALLPRGNDNVRFRVSFALENNFLIAMLRADGLAVRSPQVMHLEEGPSHIKIGFFQPDDGPGSDPSLVFDDLTLGEIGPDVAMDRWMLYDPIQQADNFEDGTLDAWTDTWGAGVVQDAASLITGSLGLGITQFDANGPTFVSYQPPVGGPDDKRFRKLTARAEFDLSSFSIHSGYLLRLIEIGSDEHAIFGVTDFELRVFVDIHSQTGFGLRPAFRQDHGSGSYTWFDGDAVPLDTLSPRLELQVGRSDSSAANNGWIRLWVDGERVSELFGLVNDDQILRTVHFGAKAFSTESDAEGPIRIDDAMVTR